ncbi:tRNA 4-thiouridine(8) synthase ThiI [Shimazuella sp. AN120528]|uniref:tRNA uracil 4-sulfurtransferase ThiI n=1 Tax=Shimazuella soli TaxID=1892854 RepID=UPI001F1132F7|nr:tRNA uracil 4-sulfurtransferase ThiI [Shimazuella soli]MCH5583909.1 tRNA 4-thiouridine(8) synthase ThiI [Shimazuella soli]
MNWNVILIRYGELSLKGRNQKLFEDRLVQNIRRKLTNFESVHVTREHGRIFVELGDHPAPPIIETLKDIFGIVSFSPAIRIHSQIDEIEQTAAKVFASYPGITTFKIESRRADKRFPIRTGEINPRVGQYILDRLPQAKVDVHHPELEIKIEVRIKGTYIYGKETAGAGGLPVGTSGKVLLLLSGGIDSPVAGYLALKRGVELHAIHFHSYPFTSERAKQKVLDLSKILTRFGGKIRLYVVPFTNVQTEIRKHCYDNYSITIMRRMMIRIAEQVAQKFDLKALITGESLGQVASQTLESLQAINDVTNMPILRPLISMDKTEIMKIANNIGTYETSILPYEDCCTVFVPEQPKTKPTVKVCNREEQKLEVESLVNEAVAGIEIIDFRF